MTFSITSFRIPDSSVARLDPRWKLAGLSAAAFMVLFLRTLPAALTALGMTLLLVCLSRFSWTWYVRRAGPVVLLIGLFVAWLPFVTGGPVLELGPLEISERGLIQGCLILAKALAVFNLMLVLWHTSPLETTLKAAHCLCVPGLVVQLLAMTYRYIFLLRDELRRLRIALRTRGFRRQASLHAYRTLGHVAGSLLVRSYERAERVAQAMQCRGFDGRYRALAEFRTRTSDILFFLLVSMSALVLLAWELLSF